MQFNQIYKPFDIVTKKWYHFDMSKKDKLLKKFLQTPPKKDLTFKELETVLTSCGFEKIEGAGSAVKFYNKQKDTLINLHKPHPSDILKVYMIKQIQIKLSEVCDG